jgi:hypothetical protein
MTKPHQWQVDILECDRRLPLSKTWLRAELSPEGMALIEAIP